MTDRHSRSRHPPRQPAVAEPVSVSDPAVAEPVGEPDAPSVPPSDDDGRPTPVAEAGEAAAEAAVGAAAGAAAGAGDVAAGSTAEAGDVAATVASALESRFADQRDKYLRLAAEYDNFRKRAARERQKAELEGMALLIRGILDALDDLGRFAHVDPGSTDARTVQEGAEMVEKKLLKHLAGHGLEVVNPAGQPFDPAVHEAVMTAPAASEAEDSVVGQVFQVGYVFNGQLLRAAKVVVKQWTAARESGG